MATERQVSQHSLYDVDFVRWLEVTAAHLRDRNYDAIDVENLLEEIEGMARSEKRSLKSNLKIILLHLLKWQFQPEKRSRSWATSLLEHRERVRELLEDSPSLKNELEPGLVKCYSDARRKTAVETGLSLDAFPLNCPYTLEQTLDFDYLPEGHATTE